MQAIVTRIEKKGAAKRKKEKTRSTELALQYIKSLDDLDEFDRLSDQLLKANSLEEFGLPA